LFSGKHILPSSVIISVQNSNKYPAAIPGGIFFLSGLWLGIQGTGQGLAFIVFPR